jgi:methanethiol oxidase
VVVCSTSPVWTPTWISHLLKIDIAEDGSMAVDPDLFVDVHNRPDGPVRAHEIRLQGGDSASEVFA